MTVWAWCFHIEGIPELGGRVVPYEKISFERALASYKGNNCDVPEGISEN